MKFSPALKRTQVGRVSYEILRVCNEHKNGGLDKEAFDHALGLLQAEGGKSKYRAEVLGQVFYGITREDAKECAEMYVGVQDVRPQVAIGLKSQIVVEEL